MECGTAVDRWRKDVTSLDYLDEPPDGATLTEYDRTHVKLYMRLLDAEADGADWREVVSTLFKLDPDSDPERARQVRASHLARARWITEEGYRELQTGASR
jgi:hypothetical protein